LQEEKRKAAVNRKTPSSWTFLFFTNKVYSRV
jgi:hypothetical protein